MRLGRSGWLGLAGGLTFLLFFLAGFPARVAARWFAPASITVADAAGTLWHGSAGTITAGNLRIGPLSWSLSPLALLTGRLRVGLDGRIGEGEASGTAVIGPGGRFSCTDCLYEGPAAGLRGLVPAVQNLEGQLRIEIAVLEVKDKWPTRAAAVVKLSALPLRPPGAPATPGAPSANFEVSIAADPVPEGGLIEAVVQDGGGPVQVTGRLAISPPGNYQLNARAKARPDAPAQVINALATMGARGPDGSTDIGLSGSF